MNGRVFSNLRRTHKYGNLPFSRFVENKYFYGNVGTYEIEELPGIMP
jgi:hypothetical protein